MVNWSELLSDPRVLSLLETVVAQDLSSVQPVVGASGEVFYAGLRGVPTKEALDLLDSLVSRGVMEKKSEGRLVACNVHPDALDIGLKLHCPSCGSLFIRSESLVQHSCGYVGNEGAFKGETCPRCGKNATQQSLKKMGRFYQCDECGGKSASPTVMLYDRKHDHELAVRDAYIIDQASFTLTPEASAGLKTLVGLLIKLKAGIESLGVPVVLEGSVKGVSGVTHTFDLVMNLGGRSVPADVKLSDGGADVDVPAVLGTYAKVLDTKSDTSFLIVIPRSTENAKKSAASYGLRLVEGRDSKQVLELMKHELAAYGNN